MTRVHYWLSYTSPNLRRDPQTKHKASGQPSTTRYITKWINQFRYPDLINQFFYLDTNLDFRYPNTNPNLINQFHYSDTNPNLINQFRYPDTNPDFIMYVVGDGYPEALCLV